MNKYTEIRRLEKMVQKHLDKADWHQVEAGRLYDMAFEEQDKLNALKDEATKEAGL